MTSDQTSATIPKQSAITLRDVLIIALCLLVVRSGYLVLGVTFDETPLNSFLQFIDPELLKSDLWLSLYFYHAAPPMLNLLAGLGLNWFGESAYWFYALVFHLLGFCLITALFYTTARLTQRRSLAWSVSLLVLISPSFNLYENWLMYTFPACALLTVSAALLLRYVDTRNFRWAFAFFLTLAILALTRSIFHLYWVVLVVAFLTALSPGFRKQILLSALLPVLLSASWYAKNDYLFDDFSASSLQGLSLNNVTTLTIPKEGLTPYVATGELTRFAVVSRYLDLKAVLLEETLAPKVGIPVLDNELKSDNTLNFNSSEMRVASAAYLQDSLKVLQLYPRHYLLTLEATHQLYFTPASLNRYFSRSNQDAVAIVTKWFDLFIYGTSLKSYAVEQPHFGYTRQWFAPLKPGYILMGLSLLLLLFGIVKNVRTLWQQDLSAENLTFGYLFGCWLLVYFAGTYFEYSENYRYRFIAEPLFWVMIACGVNAIISQKWITSQNTESNPAIPNDQEHRHEN